MVNSREIKKVYVCPADKKCAGRAEELAGRLNTYVIDVSVSSGDFLYILVSSDGLSLNYGKLCFKKDFTDNIRRLSDNRWQHELIVKACRIKGSTEPLKVFDATAGLGDDSLILAAAGFDVTLFENNPVIYELLNDAVCRSSVTPGLSEITSHMRVYNGNSIDYMSEECNQYDVIYLDPMFPEKQKKSLSKKKFQLLHMLEYPCSDEHEMFSAALKAGAKKIVVKRPIRGNVLAGQKSDYSLYGKTVRYDCYTSCLY